MDYNDQFDAVEILRSVLSSSRQSVSTNTDTLIETVRDTDEFHREFNTMVKSEIGFVRSAVNTSTNNISETNIGTTSLSGK